MAYTLHPTSLPDMFYRLLEAVQKPTEMFSQVCFNLSLQGVTQNTYHKQYDKKYGLCNTHKKRGGGGGVGLLLSRPL